MLYDLNYNCTDAFGTWQSNSSYICESDEKAIDWAKEELKYLRKRFADISYSEIILIECDITPDFHKGDRVIKTFDSIDRN